MFVTDLGFEGYPKLILDVVKIINSAFFGGRGAIACAFQKLFNFFCF